MHFSSYLPLALLSSRQAFKAYDTCATTCFSQYLTLVSTCSEPGAIQKEVACVCSNTYYDTAAAACIYKTCGAAILNETASVHEYNCNINGSPAAMDAAQFVAAGNPDPASGGGESILWPGHLREMPLF